MNIYVGNLSYRATEDDLRQAFEMYGEVASVAIVKDRDTGRSKGFGFIEMPDDGEAQEAIDGLDGTELVGRAITVNQARPRQDRRGGRERGGRDRRGRDRRGRDDR